MRRIRFQRKTVAILVAAVCLTVGFRILDRGSRWIPNLPTWNDLYVWAGLRNTPPETGGEIRFLDVGQADCTLLTAGGGAVLVDGGNNADADFVIRALRAAGITRLDYVAATHAHEDHIGGLDKVLDAFEVGAVLMHPAGPDILTRTYEDFLEAIERNGVPVRVPKAGDRYQAGDITLTVLGPAREFKDENDRSLILRAECGGVSAFLGGDAEEAALADVLRSNADLRCDIYKAGHHGSAASNPETLLRRVAPRYIVIPVGENNPYGHPAASVLRSFAETQAPVYRTDTDGTVIFRADETGISVRTEKR